MGGTLALWLAARHAEVAGLVLVNPLAEPFDAASVEFIEAMLAEGEVMAGIGSDVADPDRTELAYDGTPVRALLSLTAAAGDLAPDLAKITCPVLLFTSDQDHVVAPSSSDFVAEHVSAPVTRVRLERSFHVATLDYDAPLIEQRAAAFVTEL